ncbi:very short patch repair endonuclease [Candidatus Woesebacteria bacterium]|nr:MAG: very short patch repair endonuclease [Candidatus Woesebacteria bacterium]
MDKVSKAKRSEIMRKVKSKETKLEIEFRKKLWTEGIRYRKNNPRYFGKPDLVFKSKKVVLFIDSCFWHGCDSHLRMPNSNQDYWREKISRNKKRDNLVNSHYNEIGWTVIRLWEHELSDKIQLQKKLSEIKSLLTPTN